MQTQELVREYGELIATNGVAAAMFEIEAERLGLPARFDREFVEAEREDRSGYWRAQTFRRREYWGEACEVARGSIQERLRDDDAFRTAAIIRYGETDVDVLAFRLAVEEANRVARDPISDVDVTHNLVTNEGLAHVLDVLLKGGSQISTWYVTMSSTNTAESATMTAATPGFTEIDGTDVTETIRETWTGGSITGTTTASVDNSGSVATYTCNTAGFTAYAAALIGGGTSAFGNTAGTLYSYSLFASSKAMSSTDTIDVTYTFTATSA